MLQAVVKRGKVIPEKIPAPDIADGFVLLRVVNSCISAGTEVSGIAESGKSIVQKVMNQPDKVRKAIDMIKSKGISAVVDKIKGHLEAGFPTGYSVSGIVSEVGKGVTKFKTGDAVAAAGAGYANHADVVSVPEKLVVKMPSGMDFKDASTVAVGAIAMHGVRRADLKLGEYCVVLGTGILGLLAIQILKISGVRIAAIDLDDKRLRIAKELGSEIALNPSYEDALKTVENWTGGRGADTVLFTAATTSSDSLSQAFKMCKRKGKVVLVGSSGMEVNRDDIYSKEIDFQISTSYGPGRYDKTYEEKGLDYPYAYVRWTENRNMGEYLRLVQGGAIKLKNLISAVYPIEKATEAFESLQNSENRPIIVLLDYAKPDQVDFKKYGPDRTLKLRLKGIVSKDVINVALIGAGNFATTVHLPNILKMSNKYKLLSVMDQNGLSAKSAAARFGATYATTEVEELLRDPDIDLALITTRHNSHALLALQALNAGKSVFVEKPLATKEEDLDKIVQFYKEKGVANPVLMVGFNRRFSNYAREIKKHTDNRISPLFMHYRMNAGYIPPDHWVHDDGGRIIGEACHIIDLMSFFTNSKIESINCESLIPAAGKFRADDNKSIILKYQDGSVASIEYFSVGSEAFPKEYMEIHFDGKTIVMDDYKSLVGYGLKMPSIKTAKSEKGHHEELMRLHETLCGKNQQWPIEFDSLIETTEAAFALAR